MNGRQFNKSRILLSLTALLLIFAAGLGVTYCWIEGGNTFSMSTQASNPIKIADVSDSVNYMGTVNLKPSLSTATQTLTIADYDETTSDSLCFVPVSSADGKNFFLPTAYGAEGTPSAYRKSDTNDIGTRFISFDFDVNATEDCYLSFSEAPAFTVKRSGLDITDEADTSAFRILLSDSANTYVFSTSSEALSCEGVIDLSGSKSSYTTKTFTDYNYSEKGVDTTPLFSYKNGESANIKAAVWLDSDSAAGSNLFGCDITVDIKLAVKTPLCTVTAEAKTFSSDGTGTGGTASVEGNTSKKVHKNSSVSLTAKEKNGYAFAGWYADEACNSEPISTSNFYNFDVIGDVTYYAKFVKQWQVTVNSQPSNAGYVGFETSPAGISAYKNVDYDGSVTLYAKPKAGYNFVGWYADEACNGEPISTEAQLEVKNATSDVTYYAKFEVKPTAETTVYIQKRSNYTQYNLYAYQEVDGTTWHFKGTETDTGDKYWPGAVATLDTDTGYYKFVFTTDRTGNFNAIVSNNGGSQFPAQGDSGLVGEIGKTYLFTASNSLVEFDPSELITVKASSSTGGSVTLSGVESAKDKVSSIKVRSGDSVIINYTANDGYAFEGIYTDSSYKNKVTLSDKNTFTVTGASGSTVTYYAKFTNDLVDYYFDVNAVSFHGNDNCKLAVSVDNGASYIAGSKVTYCDITYWKVSLPSGTTNMIVARDNGSTNSNGTPKVYNTFSTTVSGSNNLFIVNSSHTGGAWLTYTPGARLVIIDTSKCSFFNNDSAVCAINPNGNTSYVKCSTFTYDNKTYYYYNLDSSVTKFKIARYISSSKIYNESNDISVSSGNNLWTIDTDSKNCSGSWSKISL